MSYHFLFIYRKLFSFSLLCQIMYRFQHCCCVVSWPQVSLIKVRSDVDSAFSSSVELTGTIYARFTLTCDTKSAVVYTEVYIAQHCDLFDGSSKVSSTHKMFFALNSMTHITSLSFFCSVCDFIYHDIYLSTYLSIFEEWIFLFVCFHFGPNVF